MTSSENADGMRTPFCFQDSKTNPIAFDCMNDETKEEEAKEIQALSIWEDHEPVGSQGFQTWNAQTEPDAELDIRTTSQPRDLGDLLRKACKRGRSQREEVGAKTRHALSANDVLENMQTLGHGERPACGKGARGLFRNNREREMNVQERSEMLKKNCYVPDFSSPESESPPSAVGIKGLNFTASNGYSNCQWSDGEEQGEMFNEIYDAETFPSSMAIIDPGFLLLSTQPSAQSDLRQVQAWMSRSFIRHFDLDIGENAESMREIDFTKSVATKLLPELVEHKQSLTDCEAVAQETSATVEVDCSDLGEYSSLNMGQGNNLHNHSRPDSDVVSRGYPSRLGDQQGTQEIPSAWGRNNMDCFRHSDNGRKNHSVERGSGSIFSGFLPLPDRGCCQIPHPTSARSNTVWARTCKSDTSLGINNCPTASKNVLSRISRSGSITNSSKVKTAVSSNTCDVLLETLAYYNDNVLSENEGEKEMACTNELDNTNSKMIAASRKRVLTPEGIDKSGNDRKQEACAIGTDKPRRIGERDWQNINNLHMCNRSQKRVDEYVGEGPGQVGEVGTHRAGSFNDEIHRDIDDSELQNDDLCTVKSRLIWNPGVTNSAGGEFTRHEYREDLAVSVGNEGHPAIGEGERHSVFMEIQVEGHSAEVADETNKSLIKCLDREGPAIQRRRCADPSSDQALNKDDWCIPSHEIRTQTGSAISYGGATHPEDIPTREGGVSLSGVAGEAVLSFQFPAHSKDRPLHQPKLCGREDVIEDCIRKQVELYTSGDFTAGNVDDVTAAGDGDDGGGDDDSNGGDDNGDGDGDENDGDGAGKTDGNCEDKKCIGNIDEGYDDDEVLNNDELNVKGENDDAIGSRKTEYHDNMGISEREKYIYDEFKGLSGKSGYVDDEDDDVDDYDAGNRADAGL